MNPITQTLSSGYYVTFPREASFADIITGSLLLLLAAGLAFDLWLMRNSQ